MGKKPDGTPYVEYYISMLLGFCQGPVDELVQITVKDKQLLGDDDAYADYTVISVNEEKLFGGHLREGGLVGDIDYLPGKENQVAPQSLAERVGLDRYNMPAFRGQAALWFHGNDNSRAKGFAVACNSPQVPAVEARFRNHMRRLQNNVPVIPSPNGKWLDCNPANMIYEALVHPFLMGGLPSQVNTDDGARSFNAAAQTLFDENFGLSLLWDGQSTIEEYVQDIIDHINAIVYFNPYTGKMDIVLLRDDYDPDELDELGPDNCVLEQWRRPLWGETKNEIVIVWTSPKREEDTSIFFQDLANIAMQGQVVSETREFRGIRNKELANKVGARELRSAASPLASATIRVNRRVRKFLPGSVFKLNWPARNIESVIMRVMEIDWGSPDDAEITLTCLEDVFGFPYAEYLEPEETEWEPPEQDPDELAAGGFEVMFRATPKSLINRRAPPTYELTDDMYNQIAINTYVLPTDEQFDLNYYIPYRPTVDTLGETNWRALGEKRVVGHATLETDSIEQEVRSRIVLSPTIGPGDWPQVGWLGLFVGADEFTDELFVFERYWGDYEWTIRRGVLDTVPSKEKWTKGTRVIIHPNNYNGYDWSARFADTAERYKFQIRTSKGLSDLDLTNEITTTRPDRPYRPYRPANCKIELEMFGLADESQAVDPPDQDIFNKYHVPRKWKLKCSWNRRNRFAEDLVWLAWDDADVSPEDGQTTELIFMAGDAELSRVTGLTGTYHEFDIIETTGRLLDLSVKFISRRDGLESLQGVTIDLKLYLKGYGSDWGYLWGGWPDNGILTDIETDLVGRLPTANIEVDSG